jgi:D-alanine-D-alanine ligase|tara:strand:+ start:8796 stop:9929 length:1134 start_codon:yes stop_codon:yes gene_type:complete
MSITKMRIGILFGGRSGEHEVSLRSARSVLQAIDREKYSVSLIGITKNGRWIGGENPLAALEDGDEAIERCPDTILLIDPVDNSLIQISRNSNDETIYINKTEDLDVIFPVLHGSFGEDGAVQGLFELADIPYVGSGLVGSSVGMDKGVFKSVMCSAGLPVLPSMTVNRSEYRSNTAIMVDRIIRKLTLPVFIKPANLGSSVGITKANNIGELKSGLDEASKWDRRIVIEEGVNAREIEVSVLGNDDPQVSIAGEVVPQRDFYDYDAKYVSDDSELLIPAPISPDQLVRIQEMAIAAYKAVDCSGMARVDFLLDKSSGKVWINELNTIPGFTKISMYPKLWQASGIEYPELIDKLIELALERKEQRDATERSFEVLH